MAADHDAPVALAARPPAGRTRKRPRSTRARWAPMVFLGPFLVPFLIFYLLPVLYAVWRSLHQISRSGGIFGTPHETFAGFSQFSEVFSDGDFRSSIGRVLLFGIVQIPVMLVLALVLALLLDSTVARWKKFFRISFFIPYGIPGVIAALIWGFIYSPQLSPIVGVFEKVSIHPDFLGSSHVLWSIANVVTWTYTGYNMLIIYSALQAIPRDIFEAATLDGASGWSIATRIKIPSVLPALVLTAIFSIIGTLQLFTEPIVFSKIATTITSTYTPNMVVLNASQNNYDFAAALSVTLAIATFVLSFTFLKLTQRRAAA
ncbi:MAG: carbohydrate ABC transporter permease [Marmoricola sp.]